MITFDKKVINQTHIHLLITHLPIVGTALGAFVLIHGIWKRNKDTLIAAYNVLIVSAIGAGIAYATGEGAEETIEHLKGISKHLIEDHEESALVSYRFNTYRRGFADWAFCNIEKYVTG
ncbi:hypothetical protein [Mucilaginibacter sp. 3215]|uniref:hypothetical protein n=1 Tax=Mucilaginibacter sp. 3215 TaxID=3373912 RepID=UPI003D1FEDA7